MDQPMDRPVNYRPLSPISFLERSAYVYRDKTAVIYGEQETTYSQLAERVYRLASSLKSIGIGDGDVVSFLCPNIPPMLEAHFGVPLTGGILGAINTRLAPKEIAFIINHSGTKALFVDTELSHLIEPVRDSLKTVEVIVNVDDVPDGTRLEGSIDYEEFLAGGSPDFIENPIVDENHAISVNYTSGTTGNPKGVLYTHRSAYLNAVTECVESGLSRTSNYLWIVPMFHCNGWCHTWGVTAVGGTHICQRKPEPAEIFANILKHDITHFCGAPTVLISMYSHPDAKNFKIEKPVHVYTGGAPPSPTILKEMAKLNIDVHQIYGLTETYGPHTVCAWQDRFDEQGEDFRYQMKARQGVANVLAHEVRVVDENMNDVPCDGEHPGEIVMRGNNVMREYYKNSEATAEAFRGGWFHSGDVAVMHADGYIEIRDRSKDVIISGGENISSIEVENMLYKHPDVLEAAVVAVPDEKWGEVPKAFIMPKPDTSPTEEGIISFMRDNLSHFKCPKSVEFGELPKTSTGKIKKFVLREKEWGDKAKRVN